MQNLIVPGNGSLLEPIRRLQPILRWAGGKQQLVRELRGFFPRNAEELTYREPFLGGASVFLSFRPKHAYLSDANEHLIKTYQWVRDRWDLVATYLRAHEINASEKHYYSVRALYNALPFSAAQAARFIYLNKSCFNGIFRVNRRGEFNVPYGWKEPPAIPNRSQLRNLSSMLQNAMLFTASFRHALKDAKKQDFVYLDPPYPPLNGTAYFTHYTRERFGEADQLEVAKVFEELNERGCLLLMTNADTPLIRRLYGRYAIASLPVTRYITCKAVRHSVRELVITNY